MAKKPLPTQEVDRTIPAGIRWLYEMEAVNSGTLQGNLYQNIANFPYVDDAEILIDPYNQKMLIWIHFNWLTRKIFTSRKSRVTMDILTNLQELLPRWKFRIIEDRGLFDKALARMQGPIGGTTDEKPNQNTAAPQPVAPVVESPSTEPVVAADSRAPATDVSSSDTPSDSKEPSKAE